MRAVDPLFGVFYELMNGEEEMKQKGEVEEGRHFCWPCPLNDLLLQFAVSLQQQNIFAE